MPDRRVSATASLGRVAIRPVEKFPEPEFSRLQHSVFADIQEHSDTLATIVCAEREVVAAALAGTTPVQAPMHRLGAYDGDDLVGWSCGWMERGGTVYMANSGVIASHRRQGVYTMLLESVRTLARTLVELSFHCTPQRQALLRSRVIPFAVPPVDGVSPGV